MSTAVSDGLQSPQGQTSAEKPGGPRLMELGPLLTPRTSPYTMAKAITGKIIVAPLHCKEKDAKLPSPAEFATGTLEDKLERLDGLIRGLGQFIQGKSNLHKEVISYQVSLGMALSALRRSLESQVPPRPPAADKAVCTSPLFTGSATSKRLATSPLASHATPKRHAVTPASKQHDENNNEVGDQDEFVLVDRRRHRQRKQTAATPGAVHARQQPKPRPVQRGARHRPDVIVIKAKDASKYADILRSLKSDPTLQQKVGSSVNNIRRSAAGALMLQLKKGVEYASDLGEELGKVLGIAATASALLHTSTIEIKDLDECATKEEVTAALDALLGVPVSKRDPVKSLRKAYAGTQLELPSGPEDHPGPPMMRILQLNLNHCEAAQDLLCDAIGELRIDVAILCEQYKNLAPPNTWLADADGQAAIWVHGGIPVQERPARVHPYFAWARIGGIFFFSVYAPPRLSEREFSALLANITEEARGRRPLVIAGDFNAWSTEWGCRETRPRASILLDSLALLDAVLLNTENLRKSRENSVVAGSIFVPGAPSGHPGRRNSENRSTRRKSSPGRCLYLVHQLYPGRKKPLRPRSGPDLQMSAWIRTKSGELYGCNHYLIRPGPCPEYRVNITLRDIIVAPLVAQKSVCFERTDASITSQREAITLYEFFLDVQCVCQPRECARRERCLAQGLVQIGAESSIGQKQLYLSKIKAVFKSEYGVRKCVVCISAARGRAARAPLSARPRANRSREQIGLN
ncbi:unnamed protein product [Trichogramma brassicae]|uniref:Endonuclease/exonuclease/phosphatase domain-containing protein n=1 Tax=Trichogramma brassicae TaxID=86971 RepID=A0A6H5IJV0_9HYME|nr:unnamed protein product [Trichogramma brassicae]